MNSRSKGFRTVLKAFRYVTQWPDTRFLTIYQPSRYAKPQTFDAIVCREGSPLLLVEIRSNQWRTRRASTVALAKFRK